MKLILYYYIIIILINIFNKKENMSLITRKQSLNFLSGSNHHYSLSEPSELIEKGIHSSYKCPNCWDNLTHQSALDSPHIGPDYSDPVKKKWFDVAKKIVTLIPRIIVLGLYDLTRYAVQRLIMFIVCPAQSQEAMKELLKLDYWDLRKRRQDLKDNNPNYFVKHVALECKGVLYSGLLIGNRSNISNGQWALQAIGNSSLIELDGMDYAQFYENCNFNTLLINGPNVGDSKGRSTPDSIADAQEVGIKFLEGINARKIIIAGHSLGGAAIRKAICQHNFPQSDKQLLEKRYLVINQMTFNRLSEVAKNLIGKPLIIRWLFEKIIRWAGCEIDTSDASKKLKELGIKEITVQAGSDMVVKDDGIISSAASLAFHQLQLDPENQENISFLFLNPQEYKFPHCKPTSHPGLAKEIVKFRDT